MRRCRWRRRLSGASGVTRRIRRVRLSGAVRSDTTHPAATSRRVHAQAGSVVDALACPSVDGAVRVARQRPPGVLLGGVWSRRPVGRLAVAAFGHHVIGHAADAFDDPEE